MSLITIEMFFKEIKQTLQLCDFLGHSQNAIEWQGGMALLPTAAPQQAYLPGFEP